LPPKGANQVWSYDFVFDTCADGRQLKCRRMFETAQWAQASDAARPPLATCADLVPEETSVL
jgi:hypothetical protein